MQIKIGIFHLIFVLLCMWISGYLWGKAELFDRRRKWK